MHPSHQSSLSFQGGTLVLYDFDAHKDKPPQAAMHPAFQWIKARWRCEAYHYPHLDAWLQSMRVRDRVPQWKALDLTFQDNRQPHDYQVEALDAWQSANFLGSIVLPTGAGKTFVAINAIQRVDRSTVVVAPTIDLLHQWYARLSNAFDTDVGVYYGSEKIIEPLTVTTYHSAGDLIAKHGNQFKLIIYDEVHHLPAPSWGETALMSPAPFRLGLTATYPDAAPEVGHRFDNRWRIEDLIGPIVYEKRIEDLIGKQLADYRTERIRIDLTEEERRAYDTDYEIYVEFIRKHGLHRSGEPNWYLELMRMSTRDREARRAVLARQRIQRLLAGCEGKLNALDKLLQEHIHEQVLIFTEHNDVVYRVARRHLIPALTHKTKAAERKAILETFRSGQYPALVTSKVLNEGVDVPEAKVAIVLGGNAGEREYIQRLGRVLRKVGNRKAVLYEMIARKTVDENRFQRRRKKEREKEKEQRSTVAE